MRAVIRTYAGSKSSKIAKPDNKLTTSFSARRFSGAVIACGSALVLDLHPAGLEPATHDPKSNTYKSN